MTRIHVVDGPQVIAGPRSEVLEPTTLETDETVVVPPEHRASFVVRKLLSEMMKPVHADVVLEENIWLEVPGPLLTDRSGPSSSNGGSKANGAWSRWTVSQARCATHRRSCPTSRKSISRDMLFDIGADTAGL